MGSLQERFGDLLLRLKENVRDAKTSRTPEGHVDGK